ncbi:hypothetical protein AALP_AA6G060400 [Arabis alpina]|uniref:Uncharacterized protein n=1 Tax=Arabis alpina TaxID=50452 RepID=A0A087GME0_ARAAL|nr:hypothetical protein AALP_AA6G060400 [Arabis alpina]
MFPQVKINRFSLECIYEFKNKNKTCITFSCILGGGWIEPRKIESEHVFIGYISSSHITKHLEGSSLYSQRRCECVPPEASIEFKVRDGAGEIVNCGLSLVYEEPNHVVIEGNGNGDTSRRDVSIGESTVSFAAGFLSLVLRFTWVGIVLFFVCGFARFFR